MRTENGLEILAEDVIHISRHSHLIGTVVATGVEKVYHNVFHATMLKNMEDRGLPLRLRKVAHSLLRERTFTIRVSGEQIGRYTSNEDVPQEPVLATIVFNIALIHLFWELDTTPKARALTYADNVIMHSVNESVARHIKEIRAISITRS